MASLKQGLALGLLFLVGLEVLVDDGDGHQDAGARANGAKEVSHNGQSANAHAAKRCGCGDVAVELLLQGLGVVTMAPEEHLLLFQLLGNIMSGRAGHLDPHLGEQGTRGEHEGDVEHAVERVRDGLSDGARGGHVVDQPADGDHLAALVHLVPCAEQLHQLVGAIVLEQQLRDEVKVGDQRGLQDDGHVGGVEELDGVGLRLAALLLGAHGQVHTETLEVDDHHEDDNRRQQVHDIGQVGAVERLFQSSDLIPASEEQVEQGNDGALKLGAAGRGNGVRAEGLPDDALADVGGDEEGDAAADAVALLQQLIQADHDDAAHHQLGDEQDGIAGAQLADVPIHA
mmetsp:Transcript_37510/g.95930  ORF Transcript_37510/g.95930 Transcript_37510/m.95930 type:complete len:343 (+) Transcript_37510:258-1286(+)